MLCDWFRSDHVGKSLLSDSTHHMQLVDLLSDICATYEKHKTGVSPLLCSENLVRGNSKWAIVGTHAQWRICTAKNRLGYPLLSTKFKDTNDEAVWLEYCFQPHKN